MEIENASTTSSKSNQLRNVNTVRWESWNVTTQPWEINKRKSEVIAFVVKRKNNKKKKGKGREYGLTIIYIQVYFR